MRHICYIAAIKGVKETTKRISSLPPDTIIVSTAAELPDPNIFSVADFDVSTTAEEYLNKSKKFEELIIRSFVVDLYTE